tara:strand:+ start:105 stop:392 length:288 start_codon:yes stop_codon:yes gene_type:complete
MDKETMRQRLIDLSKRGIDLVELMDLTIYNVKREIEVNAQQNFEVHFQHKERFNNKSENTIHKLYRSDEGEAYEILSLLIRMENHYENGRELLPE